MSEVRDWSPSAIGNSDNPPNGFPENMDFSQVNDAAREVMAAISRWQTATSGAVVSTGAGNRYVVAYTLSLLSLRTGDRFAFRANHDSPSGSVTLNVNSLGNIPLVTVGGDPPGEQGIINGGVYEVIFDGTVFRIIGGDGAIEAGSIGTAELANGSVTTPKLADSAVTSAKLASANVLARHIADRNITADLLGTSSVTNRALAANSVGSSEIVDGGIGTSEIVNGAVTLAKLSSSVTDQFGRGSPSGIRFFTSSGTFTRPAGMVSLIAFVVGGGGGGGISPRGDRIGGSGGGGGLSMGFRTASQLSSSNSVTVGSGGAGASGSGSGSSGGTSRFASMVAGGGNGGSSTSFTATAGGQASGGDVNIIGNLGTAVIDTGSDGQGAHAGAAGAFASLGAGGRGGDGDRTAAPSNGVAGGVILFLF